MTASAPEKLGRYRVVSELGRGAMGVVYLAEDEALARRRAAWTPPPPRYDRSWARLYQQHVTQADEGCDLDFLETGNARPVPEPDIY